MNTNPNYIKLFVIEQCLQFGYQTCYTNKKLNNYIYIAKEKKEIFNLYDLRAMILKLYPLITALFYKHNKYTLKFRNFHNKKKLPILEKKNYTPIQILFATTTPKLKDIIQETASFCNMPFSTGRWLNGSLTATLTKKTINWRFANRIQWDPVSLSKNKHIKNFSKNIQNFSLLIIPDAPNNKMILSEAQKKNIPTLGLLSSSAHVDLHYAIFGDYTSTYIVSFFCNLVANLILKESILCKYRENLNVNLKLHTFFIHKKKRDYKTKKTQLARYFFNYFRNIKFDNKRKQNTNMTINKQSRILKKILYFYNHTTNKKTTTILKKYMANLFAHRFLNNKKKMNLQFIYKVWQKKWPFRPWSGLRYFNDLSIFFVAFKHTKWTNFWRNKSFAIRRYNKKVYFFKKFGISYEQYRLFKKHRKTKKNVYKKNKQTYKAYRTKKNHN